MLVQGAGCSEAVNAFRLTSFPAHSGERAKGGVGGQGKAYRSLALLAELTPITFRSSILKAKFAASRRLIPCLLPARDLRRILSLSMMRFHGGLLALRVQRSLTLVPCEQDSVVRRMVEDRARRRAKIATRRKGGSRFRGGRRHLAKGRRWVRLRSATSTGVGLRGSEE